MNVNSDKTNIPHLSIHVVDHCNLNCNDCFHFTSYRKPREYQAEEYFSGLDLVLSYTNIDFLILTGGEPFLHKNLLDFINKIKTKISKITILTNGFWLNSIDKYEQILSSISSLRFSKYKPIVEKLGGCDKFDIFLKRIKKNFNVDVSTWSESNIHSFNKIEFLDSFKSPINCGIKHCVNLLTDEKLMRCCAGYAIFSTKSVCQSFKNSKEMFYNLKEPTEDFKKWINRFPFDACNHCNQTSTVWSYKGHQIDYL